MTMPILEENEPVVIVLDRSASMRTKDTPGGLSRWEYALAAIAQCFDDSKRNPVTLIVVGVGTAIYPHMPNFIAEPSDPHCSLGRGLIEALYALPGDLTDNWGKIMCIVDGVPTEDSRSGAMFLRPFVRRVYQERCVMLSVGKVSDALHSWLAEWPYSHELERAVEASASPESEPPPDTLAAEPAALSDAELLPVGIVAADTLDMMISRAVVGVAASADDEVTLVIEPTEAPPAHAHDAGPAPSEASADGAPRSADVQPTELELAPAAPAAAPIEPPTAPAQPLSAEQPPTRVSDRQGSKHTTHPAPKRKG